MYVYIEWYDAVEAHYCVDTDSKISLDGQYTTVAITQQMNFVYYIYLLLM